MYVNNGRKNDLAFDNGPLFDWKSLTKPDDSKAICFICKSL